MFLIFKCKGPVDKILHRISDLEYLVLIPKKPEGYKNCLKSLIMEIPMCEVVGKSPSAPT